jgi:hypothetical protein
VKALGGFLAGLSVALMTTCSSSAPAYADGQWQLECKPVKLRPCENALKMYFEGGIPNRCKVS